MSESKHTPEPWINFGREIGNHPMMIVKISSRISGSTHEEAEANAERIVECVNACKGIPTRVLLSENRKHDAFFEAIELEQQRDNLLNENSTLEIKIAQKQLEVEAMKAAFDEYKYNAECGMRLATQINEALMGEHGKLVEALKELMSIVKIHSEGTNNNFAWAEMDHAKQILSIINPNS